MSIKKIICAKGKRLVGVILLGIKRELACWRDIVRDIISRSCGIQVGIDA